MNTTNKAGILGESRKVAGNGPQIAETKNTSNDTGNIKNRAGGGNAAKFEPFPPDRRKMYIQKRGVDPDAIRYTPETLSETQLLELLKVTSEINGLPAVEDLCTPNNATWIFAVLDRIAAEMCEYGRGEEPENSYPFLLCLHVSPGDVSTPARLYYEINRQIQTIKKLPGVWDCMFYASFMMRDLCRDMRETKIMTRYKAYAQKMAEVFLGD